jgi:hypothetical protein
LTLQVRSVRDKLDYQDIRLDVVRLCHCKWSQQEPVLAAKAVEELVNSIEKNLTTPLTSGMLLEMLLEHIAELCQSKT